MRKTTPPEGETTIINKAGSPEQQQQIEMEILDGAFDQDKSSTIEEAVPEQIQAMSDGHTTVTRATVSTLYDSDGRVVTTIPSAYLRARNLAAGIDVPAVIGDCLFLPSTFKFTDPMPQLHSWTFKGDILRFSGCATGSTAKDFFNFLHKNGLGGTQQQGTSGNLVDQGYMDVTAFRSEWEDIKNKLIQQGKIRLVDEEKSAKFAIGLAPEINRASQEIVQKVTAQSVPWIAHSSEKKSLFVFNDKLQLFDWGDDISANWSVEALELPTEISPKKAVISSSDVSPITAAGIDPRGNFLLVGSGSTLYVLDHHEKPMEIVHKLENPGAEFDGVIKLREDGSILAGDKSGKLTSIVSNLHTFIPHRERLEQQRTLQRLRAKKRAQKIKDKDSASSAVLPEMQEISREIAAQFTDDIAKATTLDEIEKLRLELRKLKGEYVAEIKDTHVVNSIFNPIFYSLEAKETEILSAQIDGEMTFIRGLMGRVGSMSLADLASNRQRVDRVKATVMSSGLDAAKKDEIAKISDAFAEKAAEVLGHDEDKLLTQLDVLLADAKQKLEGIDKLSSFEVWQNTDYPAFLDALAAQMRIIPASHQKVIAKLRSMEEVMRGLKKQHSEKFKEQYDVVRQDAANRIDVMTVLASDRVTEFLESFEIEVRKKSFRNQDEAKQWVERNPLYTSALTVVEDLAAQDPEKADELRQKLKVQVAQLAYEVKQLKDSTVDSATGRQMATFGSVTFPVWEYRTKGRKNITIELTYKVDNSSKGPGVKPEDYMCELFYKVTDEQGKAHEIPMQEEDTLKYGRYDERFHEGGAYFPSYLTLGQARTMLSSIETTERKRTNETTRKYEEFQTKIKELNGKISKMKTKRHGGWQELETERATLTKEYVTFLQESGLYGLYALKTFRKQYSNGENVEGVAGQGRIPDFEPYWIIDDATEKALEQFAGMAKMSLELREGIISLEGHAGTGKDVLVQMFANKTKRPLYSFDCTKWTTEFDLSQDVSLAAEEGASFTVKEDSVIVKALETPGSVLYFNEFNAMPEQAQIFLHSLFDAKRQITLKTSSGRIVKAHPSVIICGSMNPKYPGTNDPQPATRSRMVPIKVKFPEFKRTDGTYASAEALRIARSVKSLQDLTYNPDMEENEFAKLWDGYINKGSANGNLTPERKFDMEVIFALITFATQLREGFVNKIAKRGGRKTFTISQPCTLREMRRCAYLLSHMDPAQKQNSDNAEKVAKDLIRRFYSQYIFDEKESEDLETNLAQWTTQKPTS